jgi:ABC-2 type transport system ATP-binding protein
MIIGLPTGQDSPHSGQSGKTSAQDRYPNRRSWSASTIVGASLDERGSAGVSLFGLSPLRPKPTPNEPSATSPRASAAPHERTRRIGASPPASAVELHRRLAYVPGDVTLWAGLSGGEVIDLLGRMRGGLDSKRRADLLERFELDPRKKCRTYSKGNRQKVALVAALVSGADLLLLDEPTSGLDPLMEAVFRECVEEERERGRTVLLSSHILSEVEALCDRVTIIRDGKAVDNGSLAELRHLTRTSVAAELSTVPSGLGELRGVHDLEVAGNRVRCQVDADGLDGLLGRLVPFGVRSLTRASLPP